MFLMSRLLDNTDNEIEDQAKHNQSKMAIKKLIVYGTYHC